MRTVCAVALLLGLAAGSPGVLTGMGAEFFPPGWLTEVHNQLELDWAVVFQQKEPVEKVVLATHEVRGGDIRVVPGKRVSDGREVTVLLLGEDALNPQNALLQHQLESIVWRWNEKMERAHVSLGKIVDVQTRKALDFNVRPGEGKRLRCWAPAYMEVIAQGVLPSHVFPQEDGSLVGCPLSGSDAALSRKFQMELSKMTVTAENPYFNNDCFKAFMRRKVKVVKVDSSDNKSVRDDVVAETNEQFHKYSLDFIVESFSKNRKLFSSKSL